MARVLATIMKWRTTRDWKDEQTQLKNYIMELLDGALASPRDSANMLLRNYLNDETYPGEAAGTALLAAMAYRMAVLVRDEFGPMDLKASTRLGLTRVEVQWRHVPMRMD